MIDPKLLEATDVKAGDLLFIVAEDALPDELVDLQAQLDEHFKGSGVFAKASGIPIHLDRVMMPKRSEVLFVSIFQDEGGPNAVEALRDGLEPVVWDAHNREEVGHILCSDFRLIDLELLTRDHLLALREQIDLFLDDAD